MLKKTDTLPGGIEWNGKTFRDYELREQIVADEVEVLESTESERALKSDAYFNICIMACRLRLTEEGAPGVTPALVMGMAATDFNHLLGSGKAQKAERASFRDAPKGAADAGAGTPQVGV